MEKKYTHSYFSSYHFVGIQGECSNLLVTSLTFGLVSQIQIAPPISLPSLQYQGKEKEREYMESRKGRNKGNVLDTAITSTHVSERWYFY
ncbi:hypothetical protein CEXT_195931 [Caerostris extrusa]|uniref:Uncharacterized protein n=1 Tax=Caerostris extrusa TaxID=172846 RepID=A0AAV4T7K2_CAEEX|nr:hypothetical protein CEXT_195931 [Caerostris extrusa]